jgi:hypothetical protein
MAAQGTGSQSGEEMSKVRVKETVHTESYFRWDGSINKLIQQLEAWRQLAPLEQLENVEIEIEPEGGYEGSCAVTLAVFYLRDETDLETREREAAQDRFMRANYEHQRKTYEMLKRKFEPEAS